MGEQPLNFTLEHGCEKPLADVIFVHGLNGDAHETWTWENNPENFWPSHLGSECEGINVYSLGYPASVFKSWAEKEMDIFERATSALDYIVSSQIGKRPLVLIGHSMGGLLIKAILRKSVSSDDIDWQSVSQSARLVIFIATPHTGASLARAVNFIAPRASSANIEILADKAGALHDMDQAYRTFANGKSDLETAVYYETYATKKAAVIVDRASSDPGVMGAAPVPVDRDHIAICKPKNPDDPLYRGVKHRLERLVTQLSEALEPAVASFNGEDFAEKAAHDRRDLLTKLIAANREHEYGAANNYQNRFAQNYLKVGLFGTAREDNDALLSEVEQRFVMHVYHPLICKGATDVEIKNAIQESVIDPLANKPGSSLTGKTVMEALWFLTEQCHLRWDAPS